MGQFEQIVSQGYRLIEIGKYVYFFESKHNLSQFIMYLFISKQCFFPNAKFSGDEAFRFFTFLSVGRGDINDGILTKKIMN